MPDLIAVDELGAFLIAEGIAQGPNATPSPVPSVWLQPRQGAPEPRDGEESTITLVDAQLSSPGVLEPWIEEAFLEVIVRSRSLAAGRLIHRAIRGRLAPEDQPGGRKLWMMGALLVEYSTLWRGEQPLPSPNNGRTYDRVQSFRLAARTKSLRGEPYAP